MKSSPEDLVSLDKYGTLITDFDRVRVYLVDFGLSEPYINTNGTHIEPGKIDR